MKTAVDSNILLDIHLANAGWDERSYAALRKCKADGALAICPVVFAECSFAFERAQELSHFLDRLGVIAEDFSSDSLFAGGHAFASYRRRGGPRQRILPDFLIGAHAATQAERLLTRDHGFARQYFRGLKIIEP